MTHSEHIQDCQIINEILERYIEGCAQADSSIMKPSFSENATIYSVDEDGKLTGGPIQTLFDAVDNELQPSPNVQSMVVRIDIEGTAASARIDAENVSGIGFTDFMNVLKVEGKWLIVSKIFQLHV